MRKRTKIQMLMFVLLLCCPGCLRQKAIVKDTFLLDVQRNDKPVQTAAMETLSVQPFTINPAFNGKGFVYRTDENQYESDYYYEYFVSPAAMITELTRNWLMDSGVAKRVLGPVSSVAPTHILEGHIKQIGVDMRDAANPKAVIEVSFFLLEQQGRDRVIRRQKTYAATEPLADETASACIAALNKCLSEILEALEADLATK